MNSKLTAFALVPPGKLRLVLSCFLSQLLALTLIRLVASEVRILSFFQNHLYACSLFGLALGCFQAARKQAAGAGIESDTEKKRNFGDGGQWTWLAYLTVILCGLAYCHASAVQILGFMSEGSTYFVFPRFLASQLWNELLMTAVIFMSYLFTIKCLTPFGRLIGADVAKHWQHKVPALLLGGAFMAWVVYGLTLSFQFSPLVLIVVILAGFVCLHGVSPLAVALAFVSLACVASFDYFAPLKAPKDCGTGQGKTFWTGFYQVRTQPYEIDGKPHGAGIEVNGNFLEPAVDPCAGQDVFESLGRCYESFYPVLRDYYAIPYLACPKPARVLILGSGAGVEAAAALAGGAQNIDAVEAQPWLANLGELNPARPYSSPKVHLTVRDPRDFLRYSKEKYDLILFGILESQTAFSPFGALRSDNFAYTAHSFYDAMQHLNPKGCLVISYAGMRPWYALRLARNLSVSGGRVDAGIRTAFRSYLIFAKAGGDKLEGMLEKKLPTGYVQDKAEIVEQAKDITPTTDDWPYIFAMVASLPRPYLVCLILLLTAMIVESSPLQKPVEKSGGDEPGSQRSSVRLPLSLVALALAFMLFCERAVATLALNLGSTWSSAFGAAVALFGLGCLAALLPVARNRLARAGWWVLLFFLLALDFLFNYAAVVSIPDALIRFLATSALPVAAAVPFGALLASKAGGSGQNAMTPPVVAGCIFIGLAVGLAVDVIAIYTAPVFLDMNALAFAVIALLLGRQGKDIKSEAQVLETK